MPATKNQACLSLPGEIRLICHTDLCAIPVYFQPGYSGVSNDPENKKGIPGNA
jgi:hypothetical protein